MGLLLEAGTPLDQSKVCKAFKQVLKACAPLWMPNSRLARNVERTLP
jgi:hypothetical protein